MYKKTAVFVLNNLKLSMILCSPEFSLLHFVQVGALVFNVARTVAHYNDKNYFVYYLL